MPLRGRLVSVLAGEDGRSWVCHATGSHYNKQEVSTSSLGEGSGHNDDGHQDGRDVVPPGPWDPDGRNWTIDNEVIWLRGCVDVVTTPVNPTVTQATCSGGVVTRPTVVPPSAQPGVRYTVAPAGTVRRDQDDDRDGDRNARVRFQLGPDAGRVDAERLHGDVHGDVAPRIVSGGGAGRPDRDPTFLCRRRVRADVDLADHRRDRVHGEPAGPYEPGQSVTVTATLTASGAAWPAQLPPSWTRQSATVATFAVKFVTVACTPVVPVAPTVKPATCVNGVVTNGTVTVATTPTGVTYVALATPPYAGTQNHVVTVRAVLLDGYAWGQMPPGWVMTSPSAAKFVVTLTAGSCQVVTPVAPSVTEAVCRNGLIEAPRLTLTNTDRINYSASPPPAYAPGQSVMVTATLTAGASWPATLPDGWTRTSDTTATYLGDVRGQVVHPGGASCPGGGAGDVHQWAVRPPTVALVQTPGIVYTLAPSNLGDGTADVVVTVTAKVEDDFGWGSVTAPWTKINASTATMTVTLLATSCTRLAPVAPTVAEAICRGGVVEPPTLLLSRTDGITYTTDDADGVYAPGQRVVVTATLAATGVAWPAELPLGWTRTSPTVATYSVTFADKACTPVVPTAPAVDQATCTAGAVKPPLVTLPATAGIVYSIAPANLGNGSADVVVTVTATVQDNYQLGGDHVAVVVREVVDGDVDGRSGRRVVCGTPAGGDGGAAEVCGWSGDAGDGGAGGC